MIVDSQELNLQAIKANFMAAGLHQYCIFFNSAEEAILYIKAFSDEVCSIAYEDRIRPITAVLLAFTLQGQPSTASLQSIQKYYAEKQEEKENLCAPTYIFLGRDEPSLVSTAMELGVGNIFKSPPTQNQVNELEYMIRQEYPSLD